ncbi:MAG: regulatory signaling modulator protein AmpE [Legionellales bacterium]|nr:regulatory signaling modulator protein AmpE [Legionellales bacterium]
MKLIITLISLMLERYIDIDKLLQRFNWWPCYLAVMRKFIKSESLWRGWLGVALVLLPPVIAIFVAVWIIQGLLHGVGELILGVIVLVYCMGPTSILHQMKQWELAEDREQREQLFHTITGETWTDDAGAQVDETLAKCVFKQTYQGIFGIIFWFIVFGPVGAVLYRSAQQLSLAAANKGSDNNEMSAQANLLLELLDWIPVRLTTLIFSLVGDFNTSFSIWWQKARMGLGAADDVVYEVSLAALSQSCKATKDFQQSQAAFRLVERGLIVAVVILAIFTLGALIS